ncbi:unnamed protein product [Adineta ricciae]|uniref:Magnesium transport protein CorA n=1 Tax=Adineta ricciae TaxID=249248 RepID=A0A814QMV5_ADIRI|nr:unnamed protein product [Adineta ricciae]
MSTLMATPIGASLRARRYRQQPRINEIKDEDDLRQRARTIKHRATTINVPPTLSSTPSLEQSPSAHISPTIYIYNSDSLETPSYTSISNIRPIRADERLWIDVPTIQDHDLISNIGKRFDIHPLVLQDIATEDQRAKLDTFDNALFLVAKVIFNDNTSEKTCVDQICFYLKENVLITFQQQPKDIFDLVKNRICLDRGRVRRSNIDYLFYLLCDTIVDRYMDVLDQVGRKIEAIEHHLMQKTSRDTLETIYDLKREMLYFRSSIYPLKEIINRLQKEEETQIIQESTIIYLKDLFDHVVQVNDTIDAYREMLSSFIDFYMMLNSNAMNEVMKTLTIISTIFIPLTFIGGVYGMNFDNMPEIHWKYGYLIVLTCMVCITGIMLCCFKRKKWF